jgi:hypothetical protein
MADVIIRDMEIPKNGYVYIEMLLKVADGEVYYNYAGENKIYTANFLFLPEGHGKCIDADALIRDKSGEATLWCGYEYQDHSVVFEEDIKNAPTIVPAEGDGKDD